MKVELSWTKIRPYLDRVALVVLLVLFFGVVLTVLSEMSTGPEEIPPLPPKELDELLPNENYEEVKEFFAPYTPMNRNETFAPLGAFNIFDYKIVRDREQILGELNKKYEKAEDFFRKGQYNYARDLLREILTTWPSHIKARSMLEEINKLEQPEQQETSS